MDGWRKLAVGLTLGGIASLGVAAWLWASEGEGDIHLRPGDREAVARGAAIYKADCASCHGANLEGQPHWRERLPNGRLPAPPHDPTGHTWHHPDAQLFALTKLGPAKLVGDDYQSDMPGFGDKLRDDQIVDVLSYIKSTWPKEIQARHDLINRRAEASK